MLKLENRIPDTYFNELFKEAKAGNEFSLNSLIDIYYKDIYRMVYYRIGSDTDAQDLTQDIFIKMASSLNRLNEPDKFKPWLYKIAVNKINDYHRKKRFLTFISLSSDEMQTHQLPDHENPEKDFIKKDFYNKLKQFTDGLSSMEKQVFTLRFLDQLEIKEISLVLKKNESTIKTHLYRAINKFKTTSELRNVLRGV